MASDSPAKSKSPSPDLAEAEGPETTPLEKQPNDDAEEEAEVGDSSSKPEGEKKESNEETDSKSPASEDQSGEATKDSSNAEAAAPTQMEWQAVWSPPHNAYYFFNSRTGETTWVNPLQKPSDGEDSNNPQHSAGASPSAGPSVAQQGSSANPASSSASSKNVEPDASVLNGIDPELAYLDPTLYGSRAAPSPGQAFSARFNARTGRFTAMDARDPTHLSEAQRAQRMSEVYFDVGKWEQELAERNTEEGTGDKRKRPTKKDMERWRESKKQKKLAKTAWLRS